MVFDVKYLFFLSSIALIYSAVTGANFLTAPSDLRSSPPSIRNLDANVNEEPRIPKGTSEGKVIRLDENGIKFNSDSEKKLMKNGQNDVANPLSLVKQRSDGTDSDDIEGFAVFVDSPGSYESSSEGIKRDKSILRDNEDDFSVDYDLTNDTIMKQVISNRYKNGSVIHNIRIAVKHPQNLRSNEHKKVREQNKVSSIKGINAGTTQHLKTPVIVHGNCSNSSCPDQETEERLLGNSTINTTSDASRMTNATRAISNNNTTTTPLKSLSLHATETTTSSATVAEDLTPSVKCSNIIYLNVANSENCVTRCLMSCTLTNESSLIDKTLPSSEEHSDINNKSSSEVPIRTYPPDVDYNTKTVDAAGNTTVHSSFSTELERSTTDALLQLHAPIGAEIKLNLLETTALKKTDLSFSLKDICLTDTCVVKAAEFLKRMNVSVDPCENFYEFACGRFLKHEIPNNELLWSVFEEIGSDIILRVISVLREPSETSEPSYVKEMKLFFGRCMKTSPGTLLKDVLQELGGWPAPHNPSWKIPSFNWRDIAFNWTYGMFVEHNFVLLNMFFYNETGKWILNLDLPVFVEVALNTNHPEVLKALEDETAIIAFQLGVDNDTIVDSIEVLHLFMEYAIHYANFSQLNKKEAFLTLGKLKKKCPHLTLLKTLPSLLETSVSIDNNELVRVTDMAYLQKIDTLIRDTPVKTQTALLVISAMRRLYSLLAASKDSSTARYCTKIVWQLYPNIIGKIYTANFVHDSTVNGVVEILSQVKNRLEKTLEESSMNDETKLKALNRLKSLLFIVTNREDRGFYRTGLGELVYRNSSFASMVKAGIWNFKQGAYAFLHQDYNSTLPSFIQKYSGNAYNVNAFYTNSYVFIPFSIMHDNIYNDALPSYVNYAGVGIILGHEIVHGVVKGGFSKNASKYHAEEQCLIDQFSDFTERYLGLPIDGNVTKEENLADLGGFREAYLAYTDWASHHAKSELKLPGLHRFNGRQMFWLTAASNWCQVSSREAMTIILHHSTHHAPTENRINGQLANLPEFSRDFHCPLNAPMNPQEKCSLW